MRIKQIHQDLPPRAPGMVHDIMRLGIAKLQHAIAPKNQEDLGLLLRFLAPNGGGTAKIAQLVAAARTYPEPITGNTQWWQELFNAFGPVPQQIQAEALRAAEAEVAHSEKVYHGLAGSRPPQQQRASATDATKLQALLRAKAEREAAAAKLAALKDQYAKLVGGHDPHIKVEAFDKLRERAQQVQQGVQAGVQQARAAIANPGHTRTGIQGRAQGLDNHRIAGTVVRLLAKRMGEYLQLKLREHNLTPEYLSELHEMAVRQEATGQPLNSNLQQEIEQAVALFQKIG